MGILVPVVAGATCRSADRDVWHGLTPLSPRSVDVTMSYFKRLLRRAHADRLIGADPTARVRLPRSRTTRPGRRRDRR